MLYNASHGAPTKQDVKIERLEEVVTELRVLAHFLKEGLNVNDSISDVRLDVQNEAE